MTASLSVQASYGCREGLDASRLQVRAPKAPALPPVTAFDLSVPGLILGEVQVDGRPGYRVRLCTPRPGAIACIDAMTGLRLGVRWGLGPATCRHRHRRMHLVACDDGAAVANHVARRAVVAPVRAGGQAQFIDRPAGTQQGTSLASMRDWIANNLGKP